MKKSDPAMIVLIVAFTVLPSYFVAKAIIGDVGNQSARVKTIEPISAQLVEPSPKVFNSNAINPTVEVTIGGGSSNTSALQGRQ